MESNQLKEMILKEVPNAEFHEEGQFPTVIVPKDKISSFAGFLKSNKDTAFDYLFCESAIDFEDHFMMVYHLESTTHRHQLVVKARIDDRENPEIESLCSTWIGAEYHEREIFDLFGIHFTNHPDLRKIFLDNDWVGFPMRKDYTDPVNIVER